MTSTTFNSALYLDRLAALAPPWLYITGGCLLAMKVYGPADARMLAAAGGLSFTLLLAAAFVDLLRLPERWYSAEYATAWLDLHNHAGGRILAGDTAAAGAARVRPGLGLSPLLRALAWPILFAIAVCLVPAPSASEKVSGEGVRREAARMERRIDEAVARAALAEPDADSLLEQLKSVDGMLRHNPEAAAEALAALAAKVDDAMTERLERGTDAAEKTSAAADALDGAGAVGADASAREKAEQAVREMLDAMERLAQGEGGEDRFPEAVREAMRQAGVGDKEGLGDAGASAASMNPEGLRRLADALGKFGAESLDAARESGLSAGRMQRAERMASGLPTTSQAMDAMQFGAAELQTGMLGDGVDGGGTEPLVFGPDSSADGVQFEHLPLPASPDGIVPGSLLARERRKESERPPDEFRPSARSAGGDPGNIYAGESAATLGPERAAAAERYFRNLAENGTRP